MEASTKTTRSRTFLRRKRRGRGGLLGGRLPLLLAIAARLLLHRATLLERAALGIVGGGLRLPRGRRELLPELLARALRHDCRAAAGFGLGLGFVATRGLRKKRQVVLLLATPVAQRNGILRFRLAGLSAGCALGTGGGLGCYIGGLLVGSRAWGRIPRSGLVV